MAPAVRMRVDPGEWAILPSSYEGPRHRNPTAALCRNIFDEIAAVPRMEERRAAFT
jgi:hypothetical protein